MNTVMKNTPAAGNNSGRDQLEVADVFRQYLADYLSQYSPTPKQLRVIYDIINCRTEIMGGHINTCDKCGSETQSYNSCRNRNCPKCQCLRQAKWIAQRQQRLLPVEYFHVVFTLPAQLRGIAFANKKAIYKMLFRNAAATLLAFASDEKWLGGQPAITMVLHTWTRELQFHPHVHCVVSAGGLSHDKSRWIPAKFETKFLFPVHALSKVFRAKFIENLERVYDEGKIIMRLSGDETAEKKAFRQLKDDLYQKSWNVYIKKPFGGASQLFKYLGRYIHRVAISNQRLIALDENGVTFHTKEGQVLSLDPVEFMRRFLMHIVPGDFTKIRHYGLFASGNVNTKLQTAFRLLQNKSTDIGNPDDEQQSSLPDLDWVELLKELTGLDITKCPKCGKGVMHRRLIETVTGGKRESYMEARAP